MKIVVCSDTHGDFGPLKTILLRESYADCYLHLGDIGGPLEEIRPFAAVRGNCDMFRAGLPLWREVMTPMGKLCCHHRPVDHHGLRDLAEDGYALFSTAIPIGRKRIRPARFLPFALAPARSLGTGRPPTSS